MTWTILMGAQGAVLSPYTSFGDIEFLDQLYDQGVATTILTGLDGTAAPQRDWVAKLVYDYGKSTEQVHWIGRVLQVDQKQQGRVYSLRLFTLDNFLYTGQTGGIRNYVAATPFAIIQGAGPPSNLLTNTQGAAVLPYGAAAAVPNKVDGANPGVALRFVSDSTNQFTNMRRLCHQARYDGASYGLEWTTTLEGANGSTPTFYLVKRRERAAAYTPEVFQIPNDLENVRRGKNILAGAEAVRIIGGGGGNTRIQSALAGTGGREMVIEDKAILAQVTCDNMAQRILEIFDANKELVLATSVRHRTPTRAGDTVTIQQTGYADTNLRVMLRHYSLATRTFTYVLGRPYPIGRDGLQAILGAQRTNTTAPQFTDLIVPSKYDRATPQGVIRFNAGGGTTAIAADAAAGGVINAVAISGEVEQALLRFDLVLDAASGVSPGYVTVELQVAFNGGALQQIALFDFGGTLRPTGAGLGGTYTGWQTIPFKLADFASGATNITAAQVIVTNKSTVGITITNTLTSISFWLLPKHQHNEL